MYRSTPNLTRVLANPLRTVRCRAASVRDAAPPPRPPTGQRLLSTAARAVAGLLIGTAAAESTAPGHGALFTELPHTAGLEFVHFNGMSGELYLVETMGGGAALLDYDHDGDLDLFLVQGHMLGAGKTLADARLPPRPGQPLTGRLYRNDLIVKADGTRTLHFTDVTEASGIKASGYGMGVATGDYDNDGRTDLYLTNFGANQLWHNNADGTFSDVTAKAGADDSRWSIGAAFLDYDRDGWLDLYVGNYVTQDLAHNKLCYAPNTARDYCSPRAFEPVPDRLLHNRGDGTFEDVSVRAGLGKAPGNGLGVAAADFNGDGWPDIYVANDQMANFLWMSRKDGTFRDDAVLAGTAVNLDGAAEASMGVDAGDFDDDGDEDLFMTNLLTETNSLFVNDGQGWFEDRSAASGLAGPSKSHTGFGTGWIDYDNDGRLDLFVANGGVQIIPELAAAGDPYPLGETNQLFANRGGGRFEETTDQGGPAFKRVEPSRGVAFGDIDNDGDTDVVVFTSNGPVRVLINNVGNRSHWLGLRVLDTHRRDALGARVMVQRPDGKPLWRHVHTDGSYASASDPRVLAGLGASSKSGAVRVYWPTGEVEEWSDLPVDRYTTLQQGKGRQVSKP